MRAQLCLRKDDMSYYLFSNQMVVNCDGCDKELFVGDFAYVQKSWSLRIYGNVRTPHSDEFVFCDRCVQSCDKGGYDEFYCVEIVNELPVGCELVLTGIPYVKNSSGNLEVGGNYIADNFLVASDNSDGSRIIDHTMYSGHDSIEGACIGNDIHERIEYLDKPLNHDECIRVLLEQKNSVRVIELGNTCKIEHKRKRGVEDGVGDGDSVDYS